MSFLVAAIAFLLGGFSVIALEIYEVNLFLGEIRDALRMLFG